MKIKPNEYLHQLDVSKINTMKNYATPCAFYGTKEELDALIEPLKGLGYCQVYNYNDDEYLLITNWTGKIGYFGFASKNLRYPISATASNIPLCLALAAMVQGDSPSDGELLFCKKSLVMNGVNEDIEAVIDGKFYSIKSINNSLYIKDESGLGHHFSIGYLKEHFRKATVPEIFAHFGVPFQQVEEKKEEVREIVGYKVPFDLYGGKVAKGDVYKKWDLDMYYPPSRSHKYFLLPKEIVETWEPVYKEVKKIRVEAGEYTKDELIKMAE